MGERISYKPKAGKRKAGTEEPAKLYGRVDSLVANSMISIYVFLENVADTLAYSISTSSWYPSSPHFST